MDAEDRELFEQSVRGAIDAATEAGGDLDDALEQLGWLDALADDPHAAVSVLFPLQGHANATSSALGHVLRHAIGVESVAPVVMPALGDTAAPGRVDGRRVVVRGLAFGAADRMLVVARQPDGSTLAGVVEVDDLTRRDVRGLDPSLGLVEVSGESALSDTADTDWSRALARAQLAVGHELVGVSRRMLELAREHSLDRIQFGQPIARFQAVRHRLAESLVAIEMADALLGAAWEDGLPETAAMAKGLAGRSARTAGRHCQQVLAGIGFTKEHDLHRYVLRLYVLDELFGASARLTAGLGRALVETRELPPLIPL